MDTRVERALWKNRIVGSGEERPADLLGKENPRNWRVHPSLQQAAMASALTEVGWVQQVIVNRDTGHLVDGHLRVMLALRRGEGSMPVLYVSLTEQEELLVLASLDPLGAMAEAEERRLDDLLRQVRTESAAIGELLAQLGRQEIEYEYSELGSALAGMIDLLPAPGKGIEGETAAPLSGGSVLSPLSSAPVTVGLAGSRSQEDWTDQGDNMADHGGGIDGADRNAGSGVAGVVFQEFDERVVSEVKYIECPSCGYKWPK